MATRESVSFVPVAIGLSLLLTGCRTPAPPVVDGPAALRSTRGYVIIDLDALRADHLGLYGYERPTSPFLDRLAARSIVAEWAFAPYPSTLVSNLSLFTSLYPPQHGVYPPSGVLSERIETLPERFAGAGFRTAGHSEGGFMSGSYGFARGFAEWTDTPHEAETDIERTFSRGVDFLQSLEPSERFFLLLHTFSPHDPYDPPEEYRSRFLTEAIDGPPPTGPTLRAHNAGRVRLSPAQIEAFSFLYDGSIRYLDAVIERFFGQLESLGLADDTTVVILADHGEEFGEHGELAHGQLYPETLRIPLIVTHPDISEGLRLASPVSNVDVAPTLYELAGISVPEGLAGRSLLGLLRGQSRRPDEIYAEVRKEEVGRSLIQLRDGVLHQLLSFAHEPDPEGTWVSRSVSFDVSPPLILELRSFAGPRRVELGRASGEREAFEVGTEWTRLEPTPGLLPLERVILASDGCASPSELQMGPDERCLSFQLRRPAPWRLELFELLSDPLAAHDVSRAQHARALELAKRLAGYRLDAVAPPGSQQLSAEVSDTLRALGYLD